MNEDKNNAAGLELGQHLAPEDLMFYVLEMLTPTQRQAADAHLGSGCAQCLQELAGVREDLGIYAVAATEIAGTAAAPEQSRARLMDEIARLGSAVRPDPVPAEAAPAAITAAGAVPAMGLLAGGKSSLPPSAPEARTASRLTPWIGWAVAAALALTAGHFYQQREAMRSSLAAQAGQIARLSGDQARARQVVDALTDRSAQRVTLTLTKAPAPVQPTGRATYLATQGTLIFLASHLDPLPAGKTYELWVIPTSGAAPVAAGTFQPDVQGNASVVTARLAGIGAAKALGVTIEPEGGSAGPTMPILLAGS